MTTIAVRRTHVPFWPAVALSVVAWLIAWFVTPPLANWVAYELLGVATPTPADRARRLCARNRVSRIIPAAMPVLAGSLEAS